MSDSQTVNNVEDKAQDNTNRAQKPSNSSRDEITENNCQFQVGDILRFVRVRFPGHAKSYPFLIGKRKLMYGQKVVAMSDRGMAVGYVNSFTYELPFKKQMLPLKSISKVASEEDIDKEKDVYKKQKETETLCQRLIEKHKLDMNLTHVEFTHFGKKVVFYFVAPARVDFRGLVKDLVNELKLRIELRQISVRDRSASMGALGPCGRELCCSSFLSRYGNVSIKMAKNQNLSLNYSKLNGVCGQLKCCLQYEDEVYSQKRKNLPRVGEFIKTRNGDTGKVTRLNLLAEQFDMITNRGHIKRYVREMVEKKIDEKEARMPERFDNISDQTSTIHGLEQHEYNEKLKKEKVYQVLEKEAKTYAKETFTELTGIEITEQKESSTIEKKAKETSYIEYSEAKPTAKEGETPQTQRPQEQSEKEKSESKGLHQRRHRPNNRKRHNNNNRGRNNNSRRPQRSGAQGQKPSHNKKKTDSNS